MRVDSTGRHNYAVQITNKELGIDMYATNNGLLESGGVFYFGGWSAGFYTLMQQKTYTSTTTNADAYVYNYQFEHATSYNCLFEREISRS